MRFLSPFTHKSATLGRPAPLARWSSVRRAALVALLPVVALMIGCNGGATSADKDQPGGDTPSFGLAWSEYPRWAVFGVADANGMIDKDAGKMGPIEKKWNVDIVLHQTEYDTCMIMYGNNTTDAVCITNMDILNPSLSRDSVAILPTSTSDGADACIAVGMETMDDLAGVNSHGLEKSVSQYMFERNLELQGKTIADFPFKNMDPAAAAQAMQTKQANIQSIVVWNPFVLQTLRTREDSKVLFDSSSIPGEIVDMVVVAKDALTKPGGEDFACAVIEVFYEVNKLMADAEQGDKTLVALGEKFSNLPLEDMKIVVEQTKFYKTPADAVSLFESSAFQNEIMPKVVDFCVSHDIVGAQPKVGYGDAAAQLNFDTTYVKKVQAGSQP